MVALMVSQRPHEHNLMIRMMHMLRMTRRTKPFRGLACYAAPLCYLAHDPTTVFLLFRKMFVTHWCWLNTITSRTCPCDGTSTQHGKRKTVSFTCFTHCVMLSSLSFPLTGYVCNLFTPHLRFPSSQLVLPPVPYDIACSPPLLPRSPPSRLFASRSTRDHKSLQIIRGHATNS